MNIKNGEIFSMMGDDYQFVVTRKDEPLTYGWWDNKKNAFIEVLSENGKYKFYISPSPNELRRQEWQPTEDELKEMPLL